jgi:hypothetical protein
LVERKLPKLEVAGSTPVRRLNGLSDDPPWGAMALNAAEPAGCVI